MGNLMEARRRILMSAPHLEKISDMEVASFETNLAKKIKNLKIAIDPVQAGSGDPSPSNIRPIDGYEKTTVYYTDRDIVPEADIKTGYYNDNGTVMPSINLRRINNYVPCTSGSGYLVYCMTDYPSSRIRVHEYDADKNWLRQVKVTGPWEANVEATAFWTASADAAYYRFSCPKYTVLRAGKGDYYNDWCPIEVDIAYGGYTQSSYDGTAILVITKGKVDMGDMDWNRVSSNGIYAFRTNLEDMKPTSQNNPTDIICSMYKYNDPKRSSSQSDLISVLNNYCYGSVDNMMGFNNFFVRNDDYTSSQDFAESVSGETLVYELAEPLVYYLRRPSTETLGLKTLIGSNTVWANTGNIINLDYWKK